MRTVLLLVEDEKFIPGIRNYFQYLKYSVRVASPGKRLRIGQNAPDLIIIRVNAAEQDVLTVVRDIQARLSEAQTLYLAASQNSKLERVLGKHGIMMVVETGDLNRIHRRIERLRMGTGRGVDVRT